jgi:DHA1 family bicyclomycin/chloramphenicol resistance-like MFS transporter
MSPNPGPVFALALASISLIGPLAVHLFMPAIPAVKSALALSDAVAQAMFSVALLGMAISTLFYGSLSDRYGRRPVLLSGLALFLLGTALSAAAESALALAVGRFVQAVGAGSGLTLGRAIAQDVYGRDRLIKAIAYLTMAYTIGPMISPMIGGILIDAFGWRAVFGFALALGGAIALGAYLAIPESRAPSPDNRVSGNVFRNYIELFRHPRFTGFVLQTGFMSGTFLVMASAAATLLKDMLQRPSAEFGLYFLLFPFGYLSGNFIASRFGNRVAKEPMVLAGSLIGLSAVVAQSGLLWGGVVTPLTLFVPGFFATMGQGISVSYAQGGAMETEPRLAGTAAGVGVFLQHFCGAAFAQLYGLLADGTPGPLTQTIAISSLLAVAAALVPFVLWRRAPGT